MFKWMLDTFWSGDKLKKTLQEVEEAFKNKADTSVPNFGTYGGHFPPVMPTTSSAQRPILHAPLKNTVSRIRTVSKLNAENFCSRIELRMASLIDARINAKTESEKETITLSIDILEMTLQLVKEVFIHIPENENS